MDNILEKLLTGLNHLNTIGVIPGIPGSVITIYDHFKNRNNTHIEETYTAMRNKSKEAYGLYCAYRNHKRNSLGLPTEEKIIGYWESCLQRNVLPSIDDMVTQKTACKEEAEIIFPYLMESWMEVPDFVGWLHDILTQNQFNDLSEKLLHLQKNFEALSLLTKKIEQQGINYMAIPILPSHIIDAKRSCSYSDVKNYYMVSNNFHVMFRVISAEKDIPHKDALQLIEEPLQNASPVIISGNSGMGKTSLMMRSAIHRAAAGHIVLWLTLSNDNVITEPMASVFFNNITKSVPEGQRALLCIDNPFEGEKSFLNLQKMWPDNGKIQLMMAERTNRLAILADPAQSYLSGWFDNTQTIMLLGTKLSIIPHTLDKYKPLYTLETEKRRKQILSNCVSLLAENGAITKSTGTDLVTTTLRKFGKPEVSLVELIYRTLFEVQKIESKSGSVKLDWDEWGDLINSKFGETDSAAQLYGIVAAFNAFNTSLTLTLFCRHFDIPERKLKNCLKERLMTYYIEPVIFHEKNNTIKPKHDVIAELFFLFHKQKFTLNDFMSDLLKSMDENEVEKMLETIVTTKGFPKIQRYEVGKIDYWLFMNTIYQRTQNEPFRLSNDAAARLCLGFLWANSHKNKNKALIKEVLEKTAPALVKENIFITLYTEWGIWARQTRQFSLAEEKFNAVIEIKEDDCPARVELGILYTKQNRKPDAEVLFKEVIHLDSKNVPARTELGKLYVEQHKFDEAEKLFREALQFDLWSRRQPHTELGKLLILRGDKAGAITQFEKALEIDSGYHPARKELEKLQGRKPRKER